MDNVDLFDTLDVVLNEEMLILERAVISNTFMMNFIEIVRDYE